MLQKKLFLALMAVAAIVLVGCKDKNNEPQLKGRNLVVYGKIYTAEKDAIADAFVVEDGKFVYVGNAAGAKEYEKEGIPVIDYTGKGLVIPGCTEGHGHFVGIDGIVHQLPGFRASYDELIRRIVPETMASKPGPFFSFGWNNVLYGFV